MIKEITSLVANAYDKTFEYRMMLAFVFGKPYSKEMESEQYQKDHFLRREVMDRIREMKRTSDIAMHKCKNAKFDE